MLLLFVLVLSFSIGNNHASSFVIYNSPLSRPCSVVITSQSSTKEGGEDANNNNSGRSNPFTAIEVQEMDSLIVSLSLEPTDNSRRQRLASVFANELAQVTSAKRFADLFDQVLAVVGDRVQVEAQQKALARQRRQRRRDGAAERDDDYDDGGGGGNDDSLDDNVDYMTKSPEERQLWALVDMMVQSKTLAKKKFGELGNRGTYN